MKSKRVCRRREGKNKVVESTEDKNPTPSRPPNRKRKLCNHLPNPRNIHTLRTERARTDLSSGSSSDSLIYVGTYQNTFDRISVVDLTASNSSLNSKLKNKRKKPQTSEVASSLSTNQIDSEVIVEDTYEKLSTLWKNNLKIVHSRIVLMTLQIV